MSSSNRLPLWVPGLLLLGAVALGAFWAARGCREYREMTAPFDEVDARIDDLAPKDDGIAATLPPQEEAAEVTVTCTPIEMDGKEGAWFSLRLGERTWEITFPGKDSDETEWTRWDEETQPVLDEVARAMAAARDELDDPDQTVAVIRTPSVPARNVPPGLTFRLLDGFIRAGLQDVRFESAPAPLPPAPSGEPEER